MKKGKVYSTSDDLFDECEKRVVIHLDRDPPDPLHDYDQIFLFHSRIDRYLCGNERDEDYPDPLVEIEDEDGYGTGEYTCKDGVVAFWVSAYIHSGIALHMGTVMCAFGDTPGPGGRGWDTSPDAGFLWTDKERFERMQGDGSWMTLYDEETGKWRQAKDEAEFRDYLYKVAEEELNLLQDYIDGRCFRYDTETKVGFHKTFDDGRAENGFDWEDGEDSCGGFYVKKVGDIDFPKGDGWEVFADDDCSRFVGDEYDIPEFVVVNDRIDGRKRFYLSETHNGSEGSIVPTWTTNLDDALTFSSWWNVQSVAQDVIPKEEYCVSKNCIEKDDLKKNMEV